MNAQTDLLWHYTDADGLLGMLRSKEFWASSVEYMNDAEELLFGRKLIERAAKEVKATHGTSSERDQHDPALFDLELWVAGLTGQLEVFDRLDYPHIKAYAVSFSSHGDQLSQWRGYANGSGFAMGFDRAILERLVSEQQGGVRRLHPIIYGDAAQEFVKNYITYSWVTNWSSESMPSAKRNLLMHTSRLKHGAFSEEQEERLIVLDPEVDHVRVRTRSGRLIPYLPISYSATALRSIRVGPGDGQLLQSVAVSHALASAGWSVDDVEISVSEAPFRG